MTNAEGHVAPVAGGRAMLAAGVLAGVTAALLYVTQLSRAVGVVVAGVALVALVMGATTIRSRVLPPRWVFLVVGGALVLLAIYGIALLVYAMNQPSSTVG